MSKPQQSHLSLPGPRGGPPAAGAAGGAARRDNDDDSEPEDDDEDENDPFADRNAVVTPRVERNEPNWP